MHDIRAIRTDPHAFDLELGRRSLEPASSTLIGLDESRRNYSSAIQDLQAERKTFAQNYKLRISEGATPSDLRALSDHLEQRIGISTGLLKGLEQEIKGILEVLPNILDADVPDGADETANLVVKQHGEPRQTNTPQREHFDLGEKLGGMLFEPAARMSGARFTILRGGLARLERALGQYMLDLHVEKHGYTEMQVPLLVNDAAAYGTDKLPKFAEDLFRTTDGRWLIPTAEVPLTAMVMDQVVPVATLPIRMTALSDCFRSEAGSAGRDTRGYLRQHQFKKVELVSIVHPDHSTEEHERMTSCAEAVLEGLGLTYRRMLLCAGDTGFGAAKTFDLEVWLPGQKAWREISSCSNVRAFQARRMNARMRGADGKIAGPVHTLNGSGVALGRALIAVMETYQDEAGGIAVPPVLEHYMGGLRRVGP